MSSLETLNNRPRRSPDNYDDRKKNVITLTAPLALDAEGTITSFVLSRR